MCKIDLPRKNMVIERERARRRRERGEERLLGINARTHTHKSHVHITTQMHTLTLERVQEKVLAWVEWKKNFLSPAH